MNKTNLSISLLLIGAVLLIVEPFIFSSVTGTPVWYILPWIPSSSISPERAMTVSIEPPAPTVLSQNVHVTVLDALNSTPIHMATVEISKDSFRFTTTTDVDGTVDFEYPGATTLLAISKENYRQTMKVIPRIPDEWIQTLRLQQITWLVTLAGALGPSAFLYYKSRNEHPAKKKAASKLKKARK
jgi:hypothetical protein